MLKSRTKNSSMAVTQNKHHQQDLLNKWNKVEPRVEPKTPASKFLNSCVHPETYYNTIIVLIHRSY